MSMIDIGKIIYDSGLDTSKRNIKRMILDGAIKIYDIENNEWLDIPKELYSTGCLYIVEHFNFIIKYGKKKFIKCLTK